MKLSKGREDYLESIYILKNEKGKARVKDIASHLDVSLPSVSEMIKKLADDNYLIYEKYGDIKLTKKGEKIAKEMYEKHKLLVEFFELLGVDKKTALRDGCLVEHVLSKETVKKIKEFVLENR